jgi:hypothetical protein
MPDDATKLCFAAIIFDPHGTMRLLPTLNPLEEAVTGGAGGTEREGLVADRIRAAIHCAAGYSCKPRHTK